jgi:hypothetical protein
METLTSEKQKTQTASAAIMVTPENFTRAETDMYFSVSALKQGGFGKFYHYRDVMSIDNQTVVRANRDTLYSVGVFDIDAGSVTVTLPETGRRFMSLMAVNEDHYNVDVVYGAGNYTFTRENVGTRYLLIGLRTLIDPNNAADIKEGHRLQDAVKVDQPGGPGKFEVPDWDKVSQDKVRKALLALNDTMSDFTRAFGKKEDVDPVKHLIGTAAGWGGNPDKDARYIHVTPLENNGKKVYRLVVKDVPVDGFWSVTVYNADGYMEKNDRNAYSLNNITAKKETDGSIIIQFGGCDDKMMNCLPITRGWNYTVRLYRPRKEVLEGTWKFPDPRPVT